MRHFEAKYCVSTSLEEARIFEDTRKAFIYLPPSLAKQYTADKYCQVGERKKLILIAIVRPGAGNRETGRLV